MSELVDRVTRAAYAELARDKGGWLFVGETENMTCVRVDGDVDMVAIIRAALAAMREPTEAMTAGSMARQSLWELMIDAALED